MYHLLLLLDAEQDVIGWSEIVCNLTSLCWQSWDCVEMFMLALIRSACLVECWFSAIHSSLTMSTRGVSPFLFLNFISF